MTGLESITAKRTWFIPDFSVWGEPSLGEHEFVTVEEIDSIQSVGYGAASIGQSDQQVLYSQLTDHRGNSLPTTLESPRVFVRPRGSNPVYVVGTEAPDRFKIAHESSETGPTTVDLWVVEFGD